MVVDDAPSNLHMLQLILRRMGVETTPAEDGREAVTTALAAKAAGDSVDVPWLGLELITMDFSMPKMNGPEATQRIRAAGFTGLILGCTGNALAHDVAAFTDAGVDAVLSKPIDPAHLFSLLDKRFPGRIIRPAGLSRNSHDSGGDSD